MVSCHWSCKFSIHFSELERQIILIDPGPISHRSGSILRLQFHLCSYQSLICGDRCQWRHSISTVERSLMDPWWIFWDDLGIFVVLANVSQDFLGIFPWSFKFRGIFLQSFRFHRILWDPLWISEILFGCFRDYLSFWQAFRRIFMGFFQKV